MRLGLLVIIVRAAVAEDDVQADVELAVVDRPLQVLNQRARGEKGYLAVDWDSSMARDQIDAAARSIAFWLMEARTAVAFTGAGVSTESGIPDFRSPQGIWARSTPVEFGEFLSSSEARYEYWRQKAEGHHAIASAQPNIAHSALAEWETAGRLRGVITQNIDGLHTLAGSRRVLELHGTAREVGCLACGERFDAEPMLQVFRESNRVPECPTCRGLLKHATISFGQQLPERVLAEAVQWACEADLFLALGSSLVVTPAAELPLLAKRSGARLVIVNRDATPLDGMADLVIRHGIGELVGKTAAILNQDVSPA